MKTIITFLFVVIFLPMMQMMAQTSYTIKGRLMTKVTETITSTGTSAGSNCLNPGSVPSLASSSVTNTRLSPASFSTVTIVVYIGDSTGTEVARYSNLNKAAISWNDNPSNSADSGKFQYTMNGLSRSRFNLRAYVYPNGNTPSIYSEEFMLNNSSGIPIGTIWAYMGDGSDMTDLEINGWYLCDGRAINTTNMNQLTGSECSALISFLTRSGKQDPNSLPDVRGLFLRAKQGSRGDGWGDPNASARSGGGNTIGSWQNDGFASHNHTGYTHYEWVTFSAQSDEYVRNDAENSAIVNGEDNETSRQHRHGIPSDGGDETRPRNIYVNYIIKCR